MKTTLAAILLVLSVTAHAGKLVIYKADWSNPEPGKAKAAKIWCTSMMYETMWKYHSQKEARMTYFRCMEKTGSRLIRPELVDLSFLN